MSPSPRTDATDLIASIGRHWIRLLAFGILTLLAGVAAVAWPGPTVIAIAVLFGIQLVVVGIFQFVSAFAGDGESGGVRVLSAVLGLFAFIIGLYAIRHVLDASHFKVALRRAVRAVLRQHLPWDKIRVTVTQ